MVSPCTLIPANLGLRSPAARQKPFPLLHFPLLPGGFMKTGIFCEDGQTPDWGAIADG